MSIFAKTYRNVDKEKQSNTDTTRHKIPQNMQESSINKFKLRKNHTVIITMEQIQTIQSCQNEWNTQNKRNKTKCSSTTMLINYSMGGPFPASAL